MQDKLEETTNETVEAKLSCNEGEMETVRH